MFQMKIICDYHDLHLKTDFFDVSKKFISVCYELDPCNYFNSLGLSWHAMLKITGVRFELVDIGHIFVFQKRY